MPPQEWRHEDFSGGGKNNFGFPLSCGIIPPAMKNCANSDFPRGLDVFIFTRPRRDLVAMIMFALFGCELLKKFFRLNSAVKINGEDVKEGFVWDWASTRAFAKMLGFGSLLHDWRYRNCQGKLRADWLMFVSCVKWDGANPIIAFLAFVALALGGWFAYLRHWLRLEKGWFASDAQNWLDPIAAKNMTVDERKARVIALAAGVGLPENDLLGGLPVGQISLFCGAEGLVICGKTKAGKNVFYSDKNYAWMWESKPPEIVANSSSKIWINPGEAMDFSKWAGAIEGLE